MGKTWRPIYFVVFILFAIITAVIYGNVIHGPFVYDDFAYIVRNPTIQTLNPLAQFNTQHFETRLVGMWTFALNYFFQGFNVEGYHLFNILIHWLNAYLIFILIIGLTQSPRCQTTKFKYSTETLAFWGALIFLVHPLQTQAVSFITQRFTSLATFFYLLSIVTRTKSLSIKKESVLLNSLTLLWIICAMLTKEISFTLPIILIFIERFFYKKSFSRFSQFVLATICIIPLLYISQLSHVFASRIVNERGDVLQSFTYFMTQISVMGTYIQLFLFPVGQRLLYDFPIYPQIHPLMFIGSLISLVSLSVLAWRMRKENPMVTFGICWFFITLSVESSVIPIRHVIFEHRMYLSSIGLILSFLSFILSIETARRWVGILLIAATIIFSGLTFNRNVLWSNPVKLWESNAKLEKNNVLLLHNLGAVYFQSGEFHKANEAFTRALQLNPRSYKTWHSRGAVFAKEKKWVQAYYDYHQALMIYPKDYLVYFDLGQACVQREMWDEARASFTKAVDLNPQYKEGLNALGVLAEHEQNWTKAIEYFDRALSIDAAYLPALQNRKNVLELLRAGNWQNIQEFKIKID